jgi:hypothetical protein
MLSRSQHLASQQLQDTQQQSFIVDAVPCSAMPCHAVLNLNTVSHSNTAWTAWCAVASLMKWTG